MQLFRMVSQQQPQAMNALLTSQANPWPLVYSHWQKQKRSAGQSRLLRDGFIHAVLLQVEAMCWCHHAHVALAFCFTQKTQVLGHLHTLQYTCLCTIFPVATSYKLQQVLPSALMKLPDKSMRVWARGVCCVSLFQHCRLWLCCTCDKIMFTFADSKQHCC